MKRILITGILVGVVIMAFAFAMLPVEQPQTIHVQAEGEHSKIQTVLDAACANITNCNVLP